MKTIFFKLLILTTSICSYSQGVKISTSSGNPDGSAMLEVESTIGGLLPPRMTTVQRDAINTPASALMIYNTTTKCFEFFENNVWQTMVCSCNIPSAPVAGIHSPTGTQITWNWNIVSGANGYKYNTENDYSTATDIGNSTTYVQSGLTCNSVYNLYVWAYNLCGNSTTQVLNQTTSDCPFVCGSNVSDVEGNSYTTILLGSQCWMKQSMRTTKYPDGSNITKGPAAQSSSGWDTDNAYYSCPGNTSSNAEDCSAASEVGRVYQWSAAMHGSTTEGAQGICPNGWHIPTDTEWKTLEGTLGMTVTEQNNTVWRGTNEASKMADDVPVRAWDNGNLKSNGAFGNSGLDIPGSGYRYTNGDYVSVGSEAYIITSTQEDSENMWVRTLYSGLAQVNRSNYSKARAISVRCVAN